MIGDEYPHEPSPSLAEFIEMEKRDSNAFWRLSSGDHQNLLDEAQEKLADAFNAGVEAGWNISNDAGTNAATYEFGDPNVPWPSNPFEEA